MGAREHLESEGSARAYAQLLRSQVNEMKQERDEAVEQRHEAVCERDMALHQFRTLAYEHGKELAFEQGQAAGWRTSLKETREQLCKERDQIMRLHEAAAVSAKSNAARATAAYLNCMVEKGSRRYVDE